MDVVGVDIGGTGIKAAPVDVSRGVLTADRVRQLTPQPSTPDAVAKVVAEVVAGVAPDGAASTFGATFPAVIRAGKAETAANVDPAWVGEDVAGRLGAATGRTCVVLNDADAAGLAELRFGAGRDRGGVVVMVTLGTGIGTAVFVDGRLVPNTELGHLELDGHEAETRASEVAREREDLSWKKWGHRVGRYLQHLEMLLWPDLIVVGGGVSKKSEKFFEYLETRTEVMAATLLNEAGIVGAAAAAAESR